MWLSRDGNLADGRTSGVACRGRSRWSRAVGLVYAMFACVLIAGCGKGASNQDTTSDSSHLKFVGDSYSRFLNQHRRLPEDEAEFREFVAKVAAEDPRAQGQSVDQLLTSPRDGKPYGLFTSADPPPGDSPQAAYEQDGVDGRRLIVDTAGNVQEVDEASFRALVGDSP